MARETDLESPRPPASPWQLLYGLAHRARRHRWRSRSKRLEVPVWSVGNLHWGGTGKTPLTLRIAEHLRDAGHRVVVLSRGYRRRSRGPLVVSRGDGILVPWHEAGDEPALLAERLAGVAVVVAEDRFLGGRLALDRIRPSPTIVLLDDGFSHVRLARDLDILAFPASDPYGGGRLAPGGRLREPLFSVADGDGVVLTGAADDGSTSGERLAESLRPFGFPGPGFASRTRPAASTDGTPSRVVLVTGTARPDRVRRSAVALGFDVVRHLAFRDHHAYPEASLGRIRRALDEEAAQTVLTTSKDEIKLRGHLDGVDIVELRIEAEPEPGFFDWLGRAPFEPGAQEGSISKSGSPPSTA